LYTNHAKTVCIIALRSMIMGVTKLKTILAICPNCKKENPFDVEEKINSVLYTEGKTIKCDKCCTESEVNLWKDSNLKHFVDDYRQQYLREKGFVKEYDSFHSREVTKLYPTGLTGMQLWNKYDQYNSHRLYIHYDEKGKHYCSLYLGGSDEGQDFSLRYMMTMLKRYGVTGDGE
jgi:hypothetical protein